MVSSGEKTVTRFYQAQRNDAQATKANPGQLTRPLDIIKMGTAVGKRQAEPTSHLETFPLKCGAEVSFDARPPPFQSEKPRAKLHGGVGKHSAHA